MLNSNLELREAARAIRDTLIDLQPAAHEQPHPQESLLQQTERLTNIVTQLVGKIDRIESTLENQGVQLVELPFQLNDKKVAEVVLQILMPPVGTAMESFQSRVTAMAWQTWASRLAPEQVDIALPKLQLTGTTTALKPGLTRLGLETVFSQRADLSRLSGHRGLMLDDIYQAVTVEWDELGAQAAAATAAVGVSKSLSFPVTVEVNRPFLFNIFHVPSQTAVAPTTTNVVIGIARYGMGAKRWPTNSACSPRRWTSTLSAATGPKSCCAKCCASAARRW